MALALNARSSLLLALPAFTKSDNGYFAAAPAVANAPAKPLPIGL